MPYFILIIIQSHSRLRLLIHFRRVPPENVVHSVLYYTRCTVDSLFLVERANCGESELLSESQVACRFPALIVKFLVFIAFHIQIFIEASYDNVELAFIFSIIHSPVGYKLKFQILIVY